MSDIESDLQELGLSQPQGSPRPVIANMWRRLGGGLVDLILLGIISAVPTFVVHITGIPIGQWGRLVGFGIGVAYLGLLNSELGGGRTIGKRVAGTITVDENLEPLTVGPALLRGAMLSAIFVINGISIPFESFLLQTVVGTLATGIIFCGGFLLLYNYFFNKQTRQGPHDWLAKSYVVRHLIQPEAVELPDPKPVHRYVSVGCLGLFVVLVVGGAIFVATGTSTLFGAAPPPVMNDLRADILQSGPYSAVGVGVSTTTRLGTDDFEPLVTLNIDAQTPYRCESQAACFDQADTIARIALNEYDDLESLTGMEVRIVRETHFGWFRLNTWISAAYSIEDWQERLNE